MVLYPRLSFMLKNVELRQPTTNIMVKNQVSFNVYTPRSTEQGSCSSFVDMEDKVMQQDDMSSIFGIIDMEGRNNDF